MKRQPVEENKEFLNRHKIKSTKQRNAIMAILRGTQDSMTADDIYVKLCHEDESISLSTVYRILDTFREKGIVSRSSFPDAAKGQFSLTRPEHKHHLICLKCKKMVSINDCPLTDFARDLERQTNFKITKHTLEMFGYCDNCQPEPD